MLGRFQEAVLSVLVDLEDGATPTRIHEKLACILKSVSLSAVYVTISRASKKNFIVRKKGMPSLKRGGKAQYVYTLTKEGYAALREVKENSIAISSISPCRPTSGKKQKLPSSIT